MSDTAENAPTEAVPTSPPDPTSAAASDATFEPVADPTFETAAEPSIEPAAEPWHPFPPAAPAQSAVNHTQVLEVEHTQATPVAAPDDASYVQDTPAWAAPAPPPVPPTSFPKYPAERARSGPGWGALFLISGLTALVAGVGGGVVGAQLSGNGTSSGPRVAVSPPSPGAGASTRPEGSVANIAAKTLPSVVTLKIHAAAGDATGSGWVYDDAGHIVTNNHVVADAGTDGEITAVLSNGKQLKATVVGRDVSYDLAVVKVEASGLAPLTVGRSADVVVGDPVIAVGAPLGLDSTVTTGIVSALGRPVTPGANADSQSYISAIQTDAAINPGNSGGPLLDMQGNVIGVNSAIARVPGASDTTQSGNIGVGFAIPSDQVVRVVTQLISGGKAEHPIIGVFLDPSYDGEGVRIAQNGNNGAPGVNPDGPADKAGLKVGDVITAIDGKTIPGRDEFVVAIRTHSVGDTVVLSVLRGGSTEDIKVVLAGSTG